VSAAAVPTLPGTAAVDAPLSDPETGRLGCP